MIASSILYREHLAAALEPLLNSWNAMHLFSTTAPLILIYNRATDTNIIPTRLKQYIREGVLKRLIVYPSLKQTVADFLWSCIWSDEWRKVLIGIRSLFSSSRHTFILGEHLINSLIPRINCQSNKEEVKWGCLSLKTFIKDWNSSKSWVSL